MQPYCPFIIFSDSGVVSCLLDVSPWLLINTGNTWTGQIEILSGFSVDLSHSSSVVNIEQEKDGDKY